MRRAFRLSALFLQLVSLLTLVPGAAAQYDLAFATRRYDRGRKLYERKLYERALVELHASLALYASPNTRLYIGRTLRELGRLAEAAAELEMAAREAAERAASEPRYAATRDAARRERRALESRLGQIVLRLRGVPPAARVLVGGVPIPPAARGLPVAVTPGRIAIELEVQGQPPQRREVTVAGRQSVEVELALQPAPLPASTQPGASPPRRATAPSAARPAAADEPIVAPGRAQRIAGWSLLAGGAAALVAAGVLGWRAASAHDELGSCDRDLACSLSPRREPLADDGRALAAGTYVALGIGAAAAAVGSALLLLGRSRARTDRRAGAIGVGVGVGVGGMAGALLQGSF